jgi:hypothetical protein
MSKLIGDVLREQSVISRKMHEETGAPLINVPIPQRPETPVQGEKRKHFG